MNVLEWLWFQTKNYVGRRSKIVWFFLVRKADFLDTVTIQNDRRLKECVKNDTYAHQYTFCRWMCHDTLGPKANNKRRKETDM